MAPPPRRAPLPGPAQAAAPLLLVLLLGAAPAGAQDWSLIGSFSQTGELISNIGINTDDEDDEDDGLSYGSTTGLNFNLGYETPRTQWTLGSGTRLRFFGGSEDAEGLSTFNPNARGAVSFDGGRLNLGSDFSFSRASQTFTEFDEEGGFESDGIVIDAEARRTNLGFGVNAGYELSARNTLGFSAGTRIVRFSENDDELDDNTTITAGVSLARVISPRTSLIFATSAQRFMADDFENSEAFSVNGTVGFQRTVSQQLSLTGRAGLAYIETEEDVFDEFGQIVRETDSTVSGVGGFNLSYSMPRTSFGLTFSQSVAPASTGELRNTSTLGLSVSHRIDSIQSVSLNSTLSRRVDVIEALDGSTTDDREVFAQISPSYSISLSQDWSARVGYTLRFADSDDGDAFSNRVFLSFSRSLAIFP